MANPIPPIPIEVRKVDQAIIDHYPDGCATCQKKFKIGDPISGHGAEGQPFHGLCPDCMSRWVQTKLSKQEALTCPDCRAPLLSERVEEIEGIPNQNVLHNPAPAVQQAAEAIARAPERGQVGGHLEHIQQKDALFRAAILREDFETADQYLVDVTPETRGQALLRLASGYQISDLAWRFINRSLIDGIPNNVLKEALFEIAQRVSRNHPGPTVVFTRPVQTFLLCAGLQIDRESRGEFLIRLLAEDGSWGSPFFDDCIYNLVDNWVLSETKRDTAIILLSSSPSCDKTKYELVEKLLSKANEESPLSPETRGKAFVGAVHANNMRLVKLLGKGHTIPEPYKTEAKELAKNLSLLSRATVLLYV